MKIINKQGDKAKTIKNRANVMTISKISLSNEKIKIYQKEVVT